MSESKATDANQAPNEKYGHGDEPSQRRVCVDC